MDVMQNYGIANYQLGFQARGGKNLVKTLADKKKVRNIVTSLSEQYSCSTAIIREAFMIDGNTTVNQLKGRISKFKNYMNEFQQGLRQKLAKENINVESIEIVITK